MALGKEKILLFAIRVCGALGLLALLIARCPYAVVMDTVCAGSMDYGDLYREAKVLDFRVKVPPLVGKDLEFGDPPRIGDYRYFTMGDSFFADHWGHEPFARLLSERLNAPVFNATWGYQDPVCLFEGRDNQLDKSMARTVILESAERNLVQRLAETKPCVPPAVAESRQRILAAKLFDMVFSDCEQRLRFLLSNSVVTRPIIEYWNTLLFHLFHVMPDGSPVYAEDPNFLFYRPESVPGAVTSFYYPHDDALIQTMADNVARMAATLKARYNADLIFIPIPSQYTIYHRFANHDAYDGFVPRLCAAVERRGVKTVELYDLFLNSSRLVYYQTGSHWNGYGAGLALDATMEVLKGNQSRP